MRRRFFVLATMVLVGGIAAAGDHTWPHYGGDAGGTRYSSASNINRDNVDDLDIDWIFRTGELGEGYAKSGNLSFEATPVLWNQTLYFSTGFNKIFAISAATGVQRWMFDPEIDKDTRYAEVASRGVSIWHDTNADENATCAHRVFMGTLDARLWAIDALTGKPCPGFGKNGSVDMTVGVRLKDANDYTITSPPALYKDSLIVGSAIGDNRAVELERGIVRALDARTGEVIWFWDPIPTSPDDPAYETWENNSADINGAANAWSILSIDEANDLVFIPTTAPSPDFYGGERKGDNRYANSLVALRASNGEMAWHYQIVHHDVWDYDLASQPTLFELNRNGESIPAVVQPTKHGMLFVFNRLTGEPLFPIEERPVPQDPVDGERLSPTQPFSSLPPLVDHSAVTPDDAWGLVPGDKGGCRDRIEQHRSDGIFTPPSLKGTIEYPGYAGGSNWGSAAFDSDRQYVIANTMQLPMIVTLIPRERADEFEDYSDQRGTPYIMKRGAFLSRWGIPCTPPPWGKLTAIDLNTGEIAWDVPLGTIEDDAPAIIPNIKYGVPNIGGPIVTAGGLIFIGATTDDYLRAFDIDTGEELWKGRLPAGGQATPMTYTVDGKQSVVIAAGGHGNMGTNRGDYVVAFSLGD